MMRRTAVALSIALALLLTTTSTPACACGGELGGLLLIYAAGLAAWLAIPACLFKAAALQHRLGLSSPMALGVAVYLSFVSAITVFVAAILLTGVGAVVGIDLSGITQNGIYALMPLVIALPVVGWIAVELPLLRGSVDEVDGTALRRAVLEANLVVYVFMAAFLTARVVRFDYVPGMA